MSNPWHNKPWFSDTSGNVNSIMPILVLTDGTTQTITIDQCLGHIIHNGNCTQNIEIDLPIATVGLYFTVYIKKADYTITIDPYGTNQIMILTNVAGDYIVNSSLTHGIYVELICLEIGKWYPISYTAFGWNSETPPPEP